MMQSHAKKGLERNLFILRSLVTKDFKLKYRRSLLGVVWSVLNPLLMMLVLWAVFSNILKFGDGIQNFPLYLILGTIMFNWMSNSTSAAMHSILDAGPLIKKIRVEKVIFPLEKVLFELVNFAISLIAVVIVMIITMAVPSFNLVFLPLLLVYVMLFSAGIGMLLSALAVFFRDVMHFWGVLITAWTYATPIFYPIQILPDWMQAAQAFNPMYRFITYFREIAMWNTTPGLMENLICFGMALITFLIGLFVFRKLQNKFIFYV